MITSKLEDPSDINNYELLKPKLKELIDANLGSITEIILPILDLKVKNQLIKHKNHNYGIAYDRDGFVPFIYTISLGELKVSFEDVKIINEMDYLFGFNLSDKGYCNFSIKENYISLLECNLINAPVEDSKLLLSELKSRGKQVNVITEKPSTFLSTILNSIVIGVVTFIIWAFIFYLGEYTYDSVNNGGRIFFILIPLGFLYGLIENTILETIIFIGVPFLIFILSIFGSISTKKSSTEFINEFIKH